MRTRTVEWNEAGARQRMRRWASERVRATERQMESRTREQQWDIFWGPETMRILN